MLVSNQGVKSDVLIDNHYHIVDQCVGRVVVGISVLASARLAKTAAKLADGLVSIEPPWGTGCADLRLITNNSWNSVRSRPVILAVRDSGF